MRNVRWVLKGFVFGIYAAALCACMSSHQPADPHFEAQDRANVAPYIGHTYYTKYGETLLMCSQPSHSSGCVNIPGKVTVTGFYETPAGVPWLKVALDNGSQGFVFVPTQSLGALFVDHPPVVPKVAGTYPTFLSHLDKRELERRRQLPGVIVGMSEKQVLATAWGDPGKVETLKTKDGKRDKWIYPDNNVLYFEDGLVVGIKTTVN